MMRAVRKVISKPLAHCINISFKLNYIPASWKRARVVPIFKGGDKEDPAQYRGIYLVQTVMKIMEKVVIARVNEHMTKHNLWYPDQYGFREGHSTELLVMRYLSQAYKNLNNGKNMAAIFLDVKQAFVCLDQGILMKKLENYGIPHLWFRAYFTDRRQYVVVNGEKSAESGINQGVGAGSCLGPLLFLIFVNDLARCTESTLLLYADDATIADQDEDLDALLTRMGKELEKIEEWFNANRLTLHPGKTKVLIHPTRKKGATRPNRKLRLGGVEIEEVTSFKLVGVTVDCFLGFSDHVKKVKAKVDYLMSLLARCRKSLTVELRATILRTLIQPHVDFGVAAWGAAKRKVLKPLERSLKKALRVATMSSYNAHTSTLWEATGCLDIAAAHKAACLRVARMVITGSAPTPITEAYPATKPARRSVRQRSERDSMEMSWPRSVKQSLTILPPYQIPKIYAKAPCSLRTCPPEKVRTEVKCLDYQAKKSIECQKPNCYSCAK